MRNGDLYLLRSILLAAALIALPLGARAQLAVAITVAPPPLVVYEQPPIPAPGYIWTPGYWSYGPDGYFWVPGTWVEPPEAGLLWTPGYWAWSAGVYSWNAGYWAPQIGFYGGVDYGYGYSGHGYDGGYWRDDQFYYNRTVNNITSVQIRNVYSKTVVNNVTTVNTSYVGGPGGINARPTAEEEAVARARHVQPTSQQTQHRSEAASRPELRAAVNHGHPAIAATAKPEDFTTHLASARDARNRSSAPETPVHARDLPNPPPPQARPGASDEDRMSARQQHTQLEARQAQEREALARQQERDHARLSSGPDLHNREAQQNMEHQHQQQTQQLQQRHAAERKTENPQEPKPRSEPERKPEGH